MHWLKRNPLVGTVTVVMLFVILMEGWLLGRMIKESKTALALLDQKQAERDHFNRQSLAPSASNEAAVLHELTLAHERLTLAEAALVGRSSVLFSAAAPVTSIDAYFEIAGFTEQMRRLAVQTEVVIQADERFGFGSHRSEGPVTDLVTEIFNQRVAAQYLLQTLFDAKPTALLSLQREHPLSSAQRSRRNQTTPALNEPPRTPAKGEELADFFDLPSAVSLRVPGQLDAYGFKLEFSGQTRALRTFLNGLAVSQLPFVVRSVQAEPMTPVPVAKTVHAAIEAKPIPIVGQSLSRFRVIVEWVKPVGEAGTPQS